MILANPLPSLQQATDSFWELLRVFTTIILVAATIFSVVENVGFGDSVWWAFVTAFTVGYGDLAPHTLIGRVTGIGLMATLTLFIVPLIVVYIMNKVNVNRNEFTHEEQEKLQDNIEFIKKRLKYLE